MSVERCLSSMRFDLFSYLSVEICDDCLPKRDVRMSFCRVCDYTALTAMTAKTPPSERRECLCANSRHHPSWLITDTTVGYPIAAGGPFCRSGRPTEQQRIHRKLWTKNHSLAFELVALLLSHNNTPAACLSALLVPATFYSFIRPSIHSFIDDLEN